MNAHAHTLNKGSDYAHITEVKEFITILKPRVMSLVVFTGAIGVFAAPQSIHPIYAFTTILCIALAAGAAGAINMWYERDIDALMERTKNRPLPAGRITPGEVLGFAVCLASVAVIIQSLCVNLLSGMLLLASILFYVFIYTIWLKPRTPQNIVIGGAAGAFPPMIGWAAATGDITLAPVLLFTIVFLWTPPHFWALALYRSSDYQKAGIPMLPAVAGPEATKKQILVYAFLLVASTLAPYFLDLAGLCFTLTAAVLGSVFVYYAFKTLKSTGDAYPKKLFKFSILYLFLIFLTFAIDRIFFT